MPAVATNSSLAITTNRIKGDGTEPRWVHWGTGTTAPSATDTNLEIPRPESRVQGASSREGTKVPFDTYQVIGTLTTTGTVAITEVANFDSAGAATPPVGGNVFVRGTFNPINLEKDDSIQFTIQTIYEQSA